VEIVIQNHTTHDIHEDGMQSLTQQVLNHLKKYLLKNKSSLTLVFVNAQKMRALNKQYRSKDYVTDVLSFEGKEDLGELIFCLEKMQEQAKSNQHSLDSEFLYLLIHGILHLSGYDHEASEKQAKEMFKIQDSAFEQLNTIDTALF
jgi:probable rRNA maturation factor